MMTNKRIAISILVVLIVSLVAGGVIGYKIKKCPEDLSGVYHNLGEDYAKIVRMASDLEDSLMLATEELEVLRKTNDELLSKRPQTKKTLYHAIRYVNSADFNTVVDSALAEPN
jgi:hypothetical protein